VGNSENEVTSRRFLVNRPIIAYAYTKKSLKLPRKGLGRNWGLFKLALYRLHKSQRLRSVEPLKVLSYGVLIFDRLNQDVS
jgi:hypothetical protein